MLLLKEDNVSTTAIEVSGLTKREAEILSWVAKGKTDADVATLCNLGVRTVQKHLEHIYQKLGVETRTAAAQRALGVTQRKS